MCSSSDDSSPPCAYSLVVCAPDGTRTLALDRCGVYTLGSNPGADIHLDYPWVRDAHAVIHGGATPTIEVVSRYADATLGARVLSPGERVALEHQSVVTIGAISILVHRAGAARTPASKRDSRRPTGAFGRFGLSTMRVSGLVVRDTKMRELIERLCMVAPTDVSVLIAGETGVGKELFVRGLHENSARRKKPLVTLNCATIPDGLVESELFGHERGAFSGAITAKPGLFEAADGGTLLLDELGELPLSLQPKLLRVLESGEVLRVGALRPMQVNVRIVSATNRNILTEVEKGTFRSDLYYRLNGMTLTVPPLRERPSDIPVLAEHFALRFAQVDRVRISDDALAVLRAHTWPGNVRELKSVVERAVLLAGGAMIERAHIVLDILTTPPGQGSPASQPPSSRRGLLKASTDTFAYALHERPTSVIAAEYKAELARRDKRRIREALAQAGGNQKDAAKLLGVSRRTLINRIERYGIERPRKRVPES